MSHRLLTMLDVLRFKLERPIFISPAEGSLGRFLGWDSESEHNFDRWAEVLAVDCFVDGVYHRDQVQLVVRQAHSIGFTGIGVYPDWKNGQGRPQVGFHFGVRPTRAMGDPATWGHLSGQYVSIDLALQAIEGAA